MKRKLEDFDEVPFEGKAIIKKELDEFKGISCLNSFWTWGSYSGQTLYFITEDVKGFADKDLETWVKPRMLEDLNPTGAIIFRKEKYTSVSINMKDHSDEILTNSFLSFIDFRLKRMNELTWLPWVGNRFFNFDNTPKVLVVAESHYFFSDEANSLEKHQDENFTREVIQEMAIDRNYYGVNLYRNIHKTLVGNDSFDTNKLWSNMAFYNFIQRPMNYSIKERPNYHDFELARKVFAEVLNVLQPEVCIFFSLEARNHIAQHGISDEITYQNYLDGEKIGRSHPTKLDLFKGEKSLGKVFFLQHPSSYYSWEGYRNYLMLETPNTMKRIESII